MGLFDFDQNEILSAFMVMLRYSVLLAVLPVFGDKNVLAPVKVLLSIALTVALLPALIQSGYVRPMEANVWAATTGGIVEVAAIEVVFAVVLGFVGRLIFLAIEMGANLSGTFMGFAAASQFDPNRESQTQVIGQFQLTISTLLFLVLDGHHLMLEAALESYRLVPIGGANFGPALAENLVTLTSEVLRFGLQLAAPMAFSIFTVNMVYAIMAKAMPQLNILILSFSVSALVGLFVMAVSMPAFHHSAGEFFSHIGDRMWIAMAAMAQ